MVTDLCCILSYDNTPTLRPIVTQVSRLLTEEADWEFEGAILCGGAVLQRVHWCESEKSGEDSGGWLYFQPSQQLLEGKTTKYENKWFLYLKFGPMAIISSERIIKTQICTFFYVVSCRGRNAVQSSLFWGQRSIPKSTEGSHAKLRQVVRDHGFITWLNSFHDSKQVLPTRNIFLNGTKIVILQYMVLIPLDHLGVSRGLKLILAGMGLKAEYTNYFPNFDTHTPLQHNAVKHYIIPAHFSLITYILYITAQHIIMHIFFFSSPQVSRMTTKDYK